MKKISGSRLCKIENELKFCDGTPVMWVGSTICPKQTCNSLICPLLNDAADVSCIIKLIITASDVLLFYVLRVSRTDFYIFRQRKYRTYVSVIFVVNLFLFSSESSDYSWHLCQWHDRTITYCTANLSSLKENES